jgi:hypothetical protein
VVIGRVRVKKQCPNPTRHFIWVGLARVSFAKALPKSEPVLEHFGFGLGWAGPGSTNLNILALLKGSGTFLGDQTMTRWLNHLPEPNPISFHVGSGDFCQKAAQTQPTTRWVLGQLWVSPPNYHPEPSPPVATKFFHPKPKKNVHFSLVWDQRASGAG